MTQRNRRDLCFGRPTITRIVNYANGGKDNFRLDRATARLFHETLPLMGPVPAENRRFMRRAVRFMLGQGVRQFIDVGCGLPGRGNVHEIVHRRDPDAAVVYADADPVSVVHFRSLVHAEPKTIALEADVRDPRTILEDPAVTRLIDFGRPVGLLMITTLSQIPDDADPGGVVRAFRDALAPGALLALSELTDEPMTGDERDACSELLRQAGLEAEFRPRERITRFLDGFEPVEPGLVAAPEWRPDRSYDPPSGLLLGTVARKP